MFVAYGLLDFLLAFIFRILCVPLHKCIRKCHAFLIFFFLIYNMLAFNVPSTSKCRFYLMVYSPSFTPFFFQVIIHPFVHFPVRHTLVH